MVAAYGPKEQRHGSSTGKTIQSPEMEERVVEDAYRYVDRTTTPNASKLHIIQYSTVRAALLPPCPFDTVKRESIINLANPK